MVKLVDAGINAWFMDAVEGDQRAPHKMEPNQAVSVKELAALGVDAWQLSGTDDDAELLDIRKAQNYNYSDVVTCCPDKLPNYEAKLKSFYEEHIHADPEVRYVMEGSGYFDVRDKADRWIRIEVLKGHLITLPAGIYHRFTMDEKNHCQAMRLFQGDPIWTPINRGEGAEEHDSRKLYEQEYALAKRMKKSPAEETEEMKVDADEAAEKAAKGTSAELSQNDATATSDKPEQSNDTAPQAVEAGSQ